VKVNFNPKAVITVLMCALTLATSAFAGSPSRMMGTILRHMRVRATITGEDQRLILFYMTQ
jgi:hypothetical protein